MEEYEEQIESSEQAEHRIRFLLDTLDRRRTEIEETDFTTPLELQRKQELQSEIGKIEERVEELERDWPTAAQNVSNEE